MRGTAAALLLLGVSLLFVVAASDVSSDATTSEGLSHMTAAERKVLGYINVRGPRKDWLKKVHRIHVVGRWGKKKAAAAAPVAAAARNVTKPQSVFRFERFPFRKFLSPLQHLAKRLEKQQNRGMKRYLRLRKLLLRRGLLKPEDVPEVSSGSRRRAANKRRKAAAKPIVVKSPRELALENQLAALKQRVAEREQEVRLRSITTCKKGDVYFCFRGRCACTPSQNAKCAGYGRILRCRQATEVGSVCRCAKQLSSGAARRAQAKVAARRARDFVKTCNISSAACRRARYIRRHSSLREWSRRRRYLNKMYGKTYRRYVELLARYFKKKYQIMMNEYQSKFKSNVALKKQLDELLAKHKAAMLHHAKLHASAFKRYSTLMAAYRKLDDKYNKLVDKYKADLTDALDNLKQQREALAAEQAETDKLTEENSKLDAKIKYLDSEIARIQALQAKSIADHKALLGRHQALRAEYAIHRKVTAEALKSHQANIRALGEKIAEAKERVDRARVRLVRAQSSAKAAARKAARAYKALKAKFDMLQKQTNEAAAHDQAALNTLRATETLLKSQIGSLKKAAVHAKATAVKATADRRQRLTDLIAKAKRDKKRFARKVTRLQKRIRKSRASIVRLTKRAKAAAVRFTAISKKNSGTLRVFAKLTKRHRRLQTAYRKQTQALRARVHRLTRDLTAARSKHRDAAAREKKWTRLARDNGAKEKAMQAIYDDMAAKYNKTSSLEQSQQQLITKLRNEITEIKSGKAPSARSGRKGGKNQDPFDLNRSNITTASCSEDAQFKEARLKNKQLLVHRYDHYEFYKVRVNGQMTNENIAKTCTGLGLQTPCDHPAYAGSDQDCTIVVKRALHFSYNPHHDFPRWLISGTYWYTSNGELTLYNTGTTHRWSTENDVNGEIMCVLPTRCKQAKFTWKGYRFYRVRVPGQVTNKKIAAACASEGLETPCDHPAYQNSRCVNVQKTATHLSYSPHHGDLPHKLIDRAYFYAGNNQFPLQNWRGTHRWAVPGDRDGITFCIAPAVPVDPRKAVAKWHGYAWYRVRIPGQVTNAKIMQACNQYGYQTPCDHPAYATLQNKCVTVMKRPLHLSYSPHHDFPRSVIDNMYFFAGSAGKFPLQNWQGTHRWAGVGDRHGDTLCIKRLRRPNSKKAVTTFRGFELFKVRVPGQMTNKAIKKACDKAGLLTVLDNEAYDADVASNVVTVLPFGRHMSYAPHHDLPARIINRVYFYAGVNNKFPLQSWRGTHRWAAAGDRNAVTMCAKRVDTSNKESPVAKWRGYNWFAVRVEGEMTNSNIMSACQNANMTTPCDHVAYASDDQCIVVMKEGGHLSYSPHNNFPRTIINGKYFFTGLTNRFALQNVDGTHRWARKSDINGETLCVRRLPPTRTGYLFARNGFRFYRERVNGAMTPSNVRKTCDAKNLFTVCDNPAYADGHCVAVVKRGLHLSYTPHSALDRADFSGAYFYAGRQNRLLQNWRNTHRWSGPGEVDGDTICVTPVEVDPKTVVATWRGYNWHKVLVEGPMTNTNIRKACLSRGYRCVMDHAAYNDGKCVVVNGAAHMSYNPHNDFPRDVIDRTYWYTGQGRQPLQNWRNTHRWANPAGDMWETALCIE